MLECDFCACYSPDGKGWVAYPGEEYAGIDELGVLAFCPPCAAVVFGYRRPRDRVRLRLRTAAIANGTDLTLASATAQLCFVSTSAGCGTARSELLIRFRETLSRECRS